MPIDVARHAEMLANRVRKNQRRYGMRLSRAGFDAYRLYDRDIPEVRAVVDRYADHLVVAVYEREQTDAIDGYVEALAAAAARGLGLSADHAHTKRRRTRPSHGKRYERLGDAERRMVVREGPLSFWVNLDDYLDTGLFADHRPTRRWLAERSEGKRLLNLFGYTGTFTCWAAHGGAAATVTVDASGRYLDWARDNLALNDLDAPRHRLVQADVAEHLARDRDTYDLIVCDPPSFSTRFGRGDLDLQRDHPALLRELRPRLRDEGLLLFSTNHQRFEPRLDGLGYARVEEITERTVPEDYRNRRVHRAFLLHPRG